MYEEYVHTYIHTYMQKHPKKKGLSMAGIYDSSLSLIKNTTLTKQGRRHANKAHTLPT
jgi:hypothetical protein